MSKKSGKFSDGRILALGVVLTGYLLLSFMSSSAMDGIELSLKTTTKEAIIQQQDTTNSTKQKEPILVDYVADISKSVGDKIIRMYNNVKFHHNGAIIECDSAYLYPDDRAEFFSKVIIQKDSAYIYGDRVLYDGNTNIADIFAPIVKTVQGDAVMYSYNLQFNTKTAIGTFTDGGVLLNNSNLMEAQSGEFYANDSYVKFLNSVAMRSDRYQIKTDSLGFDLNQERLDFLTKTYIWDDQRDFLMANSGNYFSSTKTYLFTSDAYINTPDNEIWADTIRYQSALKQAYMFNDIQILDSANSTIAFGDWAFYDDSIDRAVLSELPSIMSWQKEDTSYMRADTILLATFLPGESKLYTPDMEMIASNADNDSLNRATPTRRDTTVRKSRRDSHSRADSTSVKGDPRLMDSTLMANNYATLDSIISDNDTITLRDSIVKVDTTLLLNDSINDSLIQRDSTLITEINSSSDSIEMAQKAVDEVEKSIEPIVQSAKEIRAAKREARKAAQIAKRKAKNEAKAAAQKAKEAKRLERYKQRHRAEFEADSIRMDSIQRETLMVDSLKLDSLRLDSLRLDSLLLDSLRLDSISKDSLLIVDSLASLDSTPAPMERLILAYNKVRLWGKEFQGKCDSLVSFSVDSTAVMYNEPTLWSDGNQITSEMIELYTKNEELDWADFTGTPFIAQQLIKGDTLYFNQATGNRLETFFIKNELDYAFLSGSVENLYYMTDNHEIAALVAIECADLTIEFKKRQADRMIWSGAGKGPIYPIEQIPDEQPRFLDGFTWQDSLRPRAAIDIMDRRVRGSIKEEVKGYRKPTFSIDAKMLATKQRLLKEGSWSDRVDVPTVTPQFFIDGERELLY